MLKSLRAWAAALKREIAVLALAARDPRVNSAAKLIAVVVIAYAMSPIDLIPDFIPVLGLIDDLVLLPLGIWLAIRLIPRPLMAELRAAVTARLDDRRAGRLGLFLIAAIWLVAGSTTWWLLGDYVWVHTN